MSETAARIRNVEEMAQHKNFAGVAKELEEFLRSRERALEWAAISGLWWLDKSERVRMLPLVEKLTKSRHADVRQEASAFVRLHPRSNDAH